jgi:type II secretory pathway pseudopilin PulG
MWKALPTRKRTEGLTLIETITVIAIILLLTAIAMPVMFRARHSAWRTDEISKLRQLAIAGQIYSDLHGAHPVSTAQLYGYGYNIEQLIHAKRDPYPEGFVNAYLAWSNSDNATTPGRPLRKYPVTFAGIGDFFPVPSMPDYFADGPSAHLLAEYLARTTDRENAGWLVSIGEGGSQADFFRITHQFQRPILRVTFEGAVIRRPNCAISTKSGEMAYGPMPCFFDSLPGDLEI